MSLFFYGLLDIDCRLDCESLIRREAERQGLPLTIGGLTEYSLKDLFGDIKDFSQPVVFEVKANGDRDVYELLYNNYGGELMTNHYRTIGRTSGLSDWCSLEFGENDQVDRLYEITPYPIPCAKFVSGLLDAMPQAKAIFSFDHDFVNRFNCQEVSGGREFVLRQIWKTIAFGYQFPNIRIRYKAARELG